MPAVRSPVMVGRRSELATVLGLVDAATRGSGAALLVTGEAGIGKSRLVGEMRERAATAGLAVLVGRATEGGGAYRAVAEALAPPLRRRPLLDTPMLEPYRAVMRRLLPGATGTDPDPRPGPLDPSVVAGEGVLALLAAIGGDHGCLLVLEDLHWADPDTLDLVAYLAGVVSGATLLPPERAALAARAAHVLDARGEPGDREAAAGLYVEGGDSERGAEVLVELARADTARGALRSAAQLLALAAATGAPAGPVVAERVRVLTLLGRAAEALELGEAALRTVRGDEHVALFGLGAHEHGEGDPSAPSLAAARELALEAGLLVHVVQADLIGANAVLLVDGPAAAVPLLREAAERAGRLRLTGLQAMAELFVAADSALVADLPAMTGSLAAAVSRPDAPTEVVTLGPMVRALPYLMRHDLPRASALFDEAIPALLAHGSAIPIDHIGLWALLRTAVGDRDRAARETLRENRSLSTAGNRAALGYADAIAAGRAGRPDAAVALFAEAGATIARFPWWNRLLRLLALEAAVVDGWDDPVPALRVDLAAHEAAGEENLARTCRDLLRAAGAPTRRRGVPVAPALRAHGITGREAEVLALVVTGLTNAETAERLYLSPRTVETHVARLLAKTGCADRAQLRRWAGETVATGKDRDR